MKHSARRPIYVSTYCLRWEENVLERISLYRRNGIDEIELGGGVSVGKRDFDEMKKTGCRFLVHNYFPPTGNDFVINLGSADDNVRNRSLRFVFDSIELCRELNAPFYSVHAGFVADPIGFKNGSYVFPKTDDVEQVRESNEIFHRSLDSVKRYIQDIDIEVLIENNVCFHSIRNNVLFRTDDEILGVFHYLNCNKIALLLDMGHLKITANTLGFDPLEFINNITPFIRVFHVHDNNGEADSHLPVGANGWAMEVLKEDRFAEIPVVVESWFDTVEELRDHVEWLREELG